MIRLLVVLCIGLLAFVQLARSDGVPIEVGFFDSKSAIQVTGAPKEECLRSCESSYAKCRDEPKPCSERRKSCVKRCPTYTPKECRASCDREYFSCKGDMKKCAEKRDKCVRSNC